MTLQMTMKELVDNNMKKCRTVEDLYNTFPLLYSKSRGIIICKECVKDHASITFNKKESKPGVFWYEEELEDLGDNQEIKTPLSRSFRNLKIHIKSHILSETHKESVNVNREEEAVEKFTKAELEVGMSLARTCYYLFTKGRPFYDFESRETTTSSTFEQYLNRKYKSFSQFSRQVSEECLFCSKRTKNSVPDISTQSDWI